MFETDGSSEEVEIVIFKSTYGKVTAVFLACMSFKTVFSGPVLLFYFVIKCLLKG